MTTQKTFGVAGVWALLVLVAVHSLQFPGSVRDFTRASGGGILLDAIPSFTPDATYDRLATYGEAGRRNYAFRNVTVDVLLPLSISAFLFLLMRRAASRTSLRPSLTRALLAVPIAYVVLDLLENGSVLALLASYPKRLNGLAATLPYTTVVKRAASMLALGIPVAMFAAQYVRGKRRQAVSLIL